MSKGKMLEVEKKIASIPNIFGVYDVTGTYDTMVLARFRDRNELSEVIKIINSTEYVINTNTQLVLNIIKENSEFKKLMGLNLRS
ncbi:MAG: Lrp/AsnC ligand binding domain-containing protein [Promethearchaeota archaeon]